MKTLTILALCFCACNCDSSASTADASSKTQQKNQNAIPVAPKTEIYYQPQPSPQPQPQYVPVQFIPKPIYVQQAQPQHQPQPTMVIIAQPALVPQHMIFNHAAQQLLNYFNNNPQARYQLLQQYQQFSQPHPTVQPYLATAPPAVASTIGNYQFVPAPQFAAPLQYNFGHAAALTQATPMTHMAPVAQATQVPQAAAVTHAAPIQFGNYHASVQPLQLNAISHLAHLTAQQFATGPIKAAPPIITGFEQFTPEQQAQIRAQLNNHLSQGTPINTITSNHLTAGPVLSSTRPQTASAAPQPHQEDNQQYNSKYSVQTSQSQEFVGSQEDKNDSSQASSNNFQPSVQYRGQYTKG